MPYMLRRRILTDSDLDNATTWKKDLPNSGSITAFELRINCDRYADRDALAVVYPLVDCISLVELLAESTTKVASISGRQCDFFNYLDFKRPTPRRHRERAATGNDLALFLMGGRSLYDREYGFDMSKLKNAYLNYTYDLKEATAEYFKADDHDIQVYAWQWMGDGAPAFKGYFRRRQVLSYATTGSSVLKTLDITPGLPIRRIVVQKIDQDETIGGTWSKIELEVNNGQYSPVVITSPFDWAVQQVVDYGLQNYQDGMVYIDTANAACRLPPDFSYYTNILATLYVPSAPLAVSTYAMITIPPTLTAAVAGEAIYRAQGFGYQGCLNIGFDHLPNLEDVLLTEGMAALKLVLTEYESGNNGAVSIEDVVYY